MRIASFLGFLSCFYYIIFPLIFVIFAIKNIINFLLSNNKWLNHAIYKTLFAIYFYIKL